MIPDEGLVRWAWSIYKLSFELEQAMKRADPWSRHVPCAWVSSSTGADVGMGLSSATANILTWDFPLEFEKPRKGAVGTAPTSGKGRS